jgi:hypothetical protein
LTGSWEEPSEVTHIAFIAISSIQQLCYLNPMLELPGIPFIWEPARMHQFPAYTSQAE